ncbi:MAG: hypothetical protein GEV07_05860 [Streptosporangiales bacterium]|nr:hypothetical protein [Streptosporangiales bacterium]
MPHPDELAIEIEPPGADKWTSQARAVTVIPVWGSHTVLRDGIPVADLQTPLHLNMRDHLELHLA